MEKMIKNGAYSILAFRLPPSILRDISSPCGKFNAFQHFNLERGPTVRRIHCSNNVHDVNDVISKGLNLNIGVINVINLIIFQI